MQLSMYILTGHMMWVWLMQGTMQQRYAAAALQKLDWYYTPQTKRWYKAIHTPPTVDSFGRVCACETFDLVFHGLALSHPYTMWWWLCSHAANRGLSPAALAWQASAVAQSHNARVWLRRCMRIRGLPCTSTRT